MSIVVTAPDTAATLNNTAQVSGNEMDPDAANNSAGQETAVVFHTIYLPMIPLQ